MGMSLQLRESLQELLYSDKYDTEDTELIVQHRHDRKRPATALVPVIENPLFKKICRLMGVQLDHAELRDAYFSADLGEGCVFIFPFKDTEYFMALCCHRGRLEDTDAVTLAVYVDARKYVKLREYFEILWENCGLEGKQPLEDTPLIKAVLESDKKTVYYKGSSIPVAGKELMQSIMSR